MKIVIDSRERELWQRSTNSAATYCEQTVLHLGDIQFQNEDSESIVIIERKTLEDLSASIKDGRYREQSQRLSMTSLVRHRIIYLIEGNEDAYTAKKKRLLFAIRNINERHDIFKSKMWIFCVANEQFRSLLEIYSKFVR